MRGLRGDPADDPEILFETRDGGTLQTRDAQRTDYFYLNKIRRCNEQVTEFKGNLTMD